MPAAGMAALGLAHAQAVVWERRLEALRRPDPAAPEQPRALVRLPRVHDPVCAAFEPIVPWRWMLAMSVSALTPLVLAKLSMIDVRDLSEILGSQERFHR